MEKCDLIIRGKYVLPMNSGLDIIKDGIVVVEGNLIKNIGKQSEIEDKYEAKEVIDAGNCIVMPGLINTHTHAAMTYFRGLADDLPLDIWLKEHIWPAEAKYMNSEFVRKSSELACLEMIKSGTTCFNDMYFFQEETARVAVKAGIRAMIGEGILNFSTPSCKTPQETINKTVDLIEKFKTNELITVTVAPHSIYTCDKEILLRAKELADKYNLLLHIHISETKKEIEDCQKEHGKSPVAYLDEIGFLSDKVIAAHNVWLDKKDLEIYQKKGVKVSHCPMSNKKLASGIAPIPEMLKMGITVSLGTDSVASNNTLDLFSDIRTCALLHKVNKLDPTITNAQEVMKMATIDGARSLGMEDKIGSLEVGKQADMITINLDKPHLVPIYNPYSHLVYCVNGEDVNDVIVNGKVLMRNREVKTIDEEKVIKEANQFNIDN
ncbi:MAG: amidohydrolase [Patescibacteria group bacterium]